MATSSVSDFKISAKSLLTGFIQSFQATEEATGEKAQA